MDGGVSESSVRHADDSKVRTTIVILTYARDDTLKATLAHLRNKIGSRDDVEIVLVDNNADALDRSVFLDAFPIWRIVKTGLNKGVSARNDGMQVARGDLIVLLDDDVLVETPDFIDRFHDALDARPDLGVIVVRKLDGKTMSLLPECIPHTRKKIDVSKPFLTFRIVGGLVGVRRSMYRDVGGFSPEFFFGLEEHEYSYRIIKRGWKMFYRPDIVAIETNAPGGRARRREARTDLLYNRYMIAYLHMPFWSMIVNIVLFTGFFYVNVRGDLDVFGAIGKFLRWRGSPTRARRQPIDQLARDYIHACGGVTWR